MFPVVKSNVTAKYRTASGQSIANGSDVVVDFETKVYDTHDIVTTGGSWKATAKISGKYRVNAHILWQSNAWAVGNIYYLALFKNGSIDYAYSYYQVETTTSISRPMDICTEIELLAGEYIDIRAFQNTGTIGILSNAKHNWIEVSRIGHYSG